MSANFANINLQGLNTNASRLIIDENNLIDCNNIVVDQNGIIGTRRGQEYYGSALVAIKKIFGALSTIFAQANDLLYYYTSGSFSAVNFPDTNSFTAVIGTQVQSKEANKSLFFTGRRVDGNTRTDDQIKKITSTSGTVVNAGLDAPFNLSIETTTGTSFPDNTSFAIRVFYQYRDANLFTITSAVSNRIVAINTTGGTCEFLLKFQIPVQYNDNNVRVYYAISNDVVYPVTPDDNLFWSEQTIINTSQPIDEGVNSVLSFSSFILRSAISNPIDLYTNSTQEGIVQNNNIPLSALDIENYSNFTFYANLTDRGSRTGVITELPLGVTIVTIPVVSGTSYVRAATSDYTSSPVLFSGATTYEAALDFARAITATNQVARAQVAVGDYSDMGDVVGWIDKASPTLDADNGSMNSVADLNGNIYTILYDAGTGYSYLCKYSPTADTWRTMKKIPTRCRFSCLGYNSIDNEIVSVFGLDNANNQCATYIYSIESDTITTGAAPPARTGIVALNRAASAIYNNTMYVMCGENLGGTDYPYLWSYNMLSDFWDTTLTDVPTAGALGRLAPCASARFIGTPFVYMFGGIISGGAATTASFSYNINTNTWSSIAALTAARSYAGCCTIGNSIFIINGLNAALAATDTTYVYDIVSNTYSSLAVTNDVADYVKAAEFNSTIYRLGAGIDLESYRVGGIPIIVEDKYISIIGTPNWTNTAYFPFLGYPSTTISAIKQTYPSMIQFSKQGQPEAVPFLNNFFVGNASNQIKRIAALRTSLLVLKTDGIFQLNGVSPETFSLSQLDPTFILIASQSVAKLNNEVYCLSNKGIVSINESGPKILSYKIKDLIDSALATVPQANWDTAITATAYEDDYKYIITIGDKTFTYNYVTDQWTIWHSGDSSILSWAVFNNYLYYANSTRVLKERKTLTSADFQTETGVGIDCSIQFNNLEFMLGQVVTLNAMQIQQREVSGLTSEVTFMNDFNTPASNEFLLDKYICRTLPPSSSRMAFWYRPIIEWNTEIVSPGGTFSDLKLEGFDFEYTIAPSNIR